MHLLFQHPQRLLFWSTSQGRSPHIVNFALHVWWQAVMADGAIVVPAQLGFLHNSAAACCICHSSKSGEHLTQCISATCYKNRRKQWCPLLQPVCHRCPTLSTECVHLLSCKGSAHMTDGTQPCRCPLLQPVCQQYIPASWEVSVIACGVLMIGFVGLIVA